LTTTPSGRGPLDVRLMAHDGIDAPYIRILTRLVLRRNPFGLRQACILAQATEKLNILGT
jgi:hypothetical protein